MRSFVVLLAILTAACSAAAASVSADEVQWCRTSQEALADDFFAETFEDVHGVSLVDAMGDYGFKEGSGEQVGSRMTITEPRGFPDDESRDAFYASDEFAEACRVAFDAKA